MNTKKIIIAAIFPLCLLFNNSVSAQTEVKLTFEFMLTKVLETYPTLATATLQIEQAKQEIYKVESTLGWQLQSQAGVSHDVNFLNSPSDNINASVALQKQLESGSQVNISGQYSYQDSSTSISPLFPNPIQSESVDINYRIPLARGQDNPEFTQAKRSAFAGEMLQQAQQRDQLDKLAQQVIDIYFNLADTFVRLDDVQKSIKRVTRLKRYIERNFSLGLAEDKDILQVTARIKRLIAQRDILLAAWRRQQIEVSRLLRLPDITRYSPAVRLQNDKFSAENTILLEKVYSRNSGLQLQKAQLELADSELMLAKNGKEDQLDLILGLGFRKSHGDVVTGSIDQDELAGSARVEYRFDLDKRGIDARLYQALMKKQTLEIDYQRLKNDLKYRLLAQVAQIKDDKKALGSSHELMLHERRKLDEAVSRYKEGRSTTKELIDFETDLQSSNLSYENQKIETSRTQVGLGLLTGDIWSQLELSNERRRLLKKVIRHD